jgi:alpha-D-ribose 1-methylphosphonate 5-triphosphate synthase subunit PhnH
MARPGKLHVVGERLVAPAPLHSATAAVVLTLVDNETPLWLDPDAAAARDWLQFHCGADVVATPAWANFAVALSLPELSGLALGTDEAPEDSATLILQVAEIGNGVRYRLSGPGLREPATLSVSGLPPKFASAWQQNHALYPRGVDIILCSGNTIAALPRSLSIEEA